LLRSGAVVLGGGPQILMGGRLPNCGSSF